MTRALLLAIAALLLTGPAAQAADDRVRVIAGLPTAFTPEGELAPGEVQAQRAGIATAADKLTDSLAGLDAEVVHRYDTVPYVALELSREALGELRRAGTAATLRLDTADPATLQLSTSIVESKETTQLGRTGAGQTVAVLDTGVDKSHPFLGGKVVSEACFSATADCPGGVTDSTAAGSGVPCTYAAAGCRHGTHVAGITAGTGTSFNGVAPGARLISINVFSKFTGPAECAALGEDPCTKSYVSDQLKGLDRVFALRSAFKIAAVNLSLGSGVFSSDCNTDVRKAAIDNLRSAGIATIVGSGNDGSNGGVSAPSCISTAVTVGASTDGLNVADFSNSSQQVELLAPGRGIESSVPGGGFASLDGTSMAAAHVAGAWAVLRQVGPTTTVDAILEHFKRTGNPIDDPDNAVTKPRIRVLSASTRIADTGFRPGGSFVLPGGDVASGGLGVGTITGELESGTIVISGIPKGAAIAHAALYWVTLGGPDTSIIINGQHRVGELIGASKDTCWNLNQLGPNRVYRRVLGAGEVTGNGNYVITALGTFGGEAQGASLVVVYRHPSTPGTGRVVIRDGAISGTGTPMAHTFTGLNVPVPPTQVRLHVGMSDGQAGAGEDPMLFAGSPVTPADFFSGSDGPLWDDHRIVVPPALLPMGTTNRANSITASGDCLAWAYSALAYRHPTPINPD